VCFDQTHHNPTICLIFTHTLPTPFSGLEAGDPKVRGGLTGALRVCDEAVILPSATRSTESGAFKNVVMRLSGTDNELPTDIFSPNWFVGVSAVSVPAEVAEPLLKDPSKRAAALKKLAEKIPSELHDSELSVGPAIGGDANDRDVDSWVAGFDSGNNCVGLYSALQNRAPTNGVVGMSRAYKAYYLVCKAGGGVAAQTFHSRLLTSLQGGKSLDEALEDGTEPGPQGLRRVAMAGKRNRARILALAAEAIGFFTLDTISDNAAPDGCPQRVAITEVDVNYNTLRKVEGAMRSTWQYNAGCIDAVLSTGIMTSSNPQDGFILFSTALDEVRINLRNEAHNSVPFVTKRVSNSREISAETSVNIKSGTPHPDDAWMREHFAWKSKNMPGAEKVVPPSLWGSHESESFLAAWARELGLSTLKSAKLTPEIVAIGGVEPSKLRAILRSTNGPGR
tara:strand:- start:6698 stop:8050 length:1353 start_codon:yes stop_codon:yes gene_type:complete